MSVREFETQLAETPVGGIFESLGEQYTVHGVVNCGAKISKVPVHKTPSSNFGNRRFAHCVTKGGWVNLKTTHEQNVLKCPDWDCEHNGTQT